MDFDTSTENLATLFVTRHYAYVANAANIPNIPNEITNRLNTITVANPVVRNVTLPTYRALLAEARRQIDMARENPDTINTIIDTLQAFYQTGLNNDLWDDMGPPPPPPELRRNGGKSKKNKKKIKRRYFRTNRKSRYAANK
jgi:hypothetical protein